MSDRTMLRLLEARVDELTARIRQLEDRLDEQAAINAELAKAERPRQYMTTSEAAEYLRLSESLLERWRCDLPGGPPWIRVRGRVLYSTADLDEFMASRRALPLR